MAGNDYLIRVGGFQSGEGLGAMLITCEDPPPPPINDLSSSPIDLPVTGGFSTLGAMTDGPLACNSRADIWFEYEADCGRHVCESQRAAPTLTRPWLSIRVVPFLSLQRTLLHAMTTSASSALR